MEKQIKFIVYTRKSSTDEDRQVLSLDAQLRELRDSAKKESIVIKDTLDESRTAKEPGRPIFNRMLDRIEKGEADGILVWDIDRLYRNPVDEGRVRWMLQRGIIAAIRTPTRIFYPADAGLLMAVEGGRANDFIIRHKRIVARGVREKLLRGEWPGPKPIGFIYDHDSHNIVHHPKEAKIVATIFNEASTGRYSQTWISDRLAQFDIRTTKGKNWSKSLVHKFLTNRLYMGVMVWKGEAFEGKFKPIVSPETFKQVQEMLKVRSKPRKVKNGHNFPFCGLFRCTCGSMMSAQWAKGHGGLYRYYRCTRKTGVCSEPYVQEKAVIAQCLQTLKPLAISTEEANFARTIIDRETEKDGDLLQAEMVQTGEKLAAIQEKLNKLTKGYLNGIIDEESYQAAKADLVIEKTTFKAEKQRLKTTRSSSWNEPTKDVINTLELAGNAQTVQSPKEIAGLVQKIGTNRLISRKTVTFSFSEPYALTASLLTQMHLELVASPTLRSNENWWSTVWCTQ